MYKVEFLPIAKQDLKDTAFYIRDELNNPSAAVKIVEDIIEASERLRDFPYANPVHTTIRPLKNEYRKVVVNNYLLFYSVSESEKTVTIYRIVYGRRDLNSIIK